MQGYEALGYCSSSNTAFVVRADALQRCNWLPMYSRAYHLALGQELKLQGFLSHYIPVPLAAGESLSLHSHCQQIVEQPVGFLWLLEGLALCDWQLCAFC